MAAPSVLPPGDDIFDDPERPRPAGEVGDDAQHAGRDRNTAALQDEQVRPSVLDDRPPGRPYLALTGLFVGIVQVLVEGEDRLQIASPAYRIAVVLFSRS
mgnify:CR=1 FL=1